MILIDRVPGKIYKSNIQVTIEYHAGGFFVKKQVSYLLFYDKKMAELFQREEGVHPNDNNLDMLIKHTSIIQGKEKYSVSQPSQGVNILKLANESLELYCMPSIFIENVMNDGPSEIVVDNRKTGEQLIYSQVS